jgi:hypothetical protein
MSDAEVVAAQLGRTPRGPWRVTSRCSFGFPTTVATAPITETGEPFPTLYYLTCPHAASAISALESQGQIERWRARIARDAELARRVAAADEAYRIARGVEAGGADPLPGVGIAGQRDALATKCLHAHAAAFLAGLDDPVGAEVLASRNGECDDNRCERL